VHEITPLLRGIGCVQSPRLDIVQELPGRSMRSTVALLKLEGTGRHRGAS